ncbi:hypothetical protein K493DRAFT_338731 [Basidiobolus meristosporus CBS 931.73]|uniref:NudC domain-containing protein 1 n=1 Tax=Basidiobolus meristosporus CBS 931.73 TaxID=1314790 RepID=A0A1Y1Y3J3_9FUNG|nr:hypothetical protein K493DRAFT_338731 [Basidiobolus meristosporus CBS 931.73]|eukprot:ORX92570.1 hypothetical protein K493DRAFT_338731 [Basidiobolus meristosporus CBS 931.73]
MSISSQVTLPVELWPRRELLNPGFEGYKLSVFQEEERLKSCSLSNPVYTQKLARSTNISYSQLQVRSTFNHLFPFLGFGLFYIDEQGGIVFIEFQQNGSQGLPILLGGFKLDLSEDTEESHTNLPSLHALSRELLLLTNGTGTLHLVRFDLASKVLNLVGEASYRIGSDGDTKLHPSLILDAKLVEEYIYCVLSSQEPGGVTHRAAQLIDFIKIAHSHSGSIGAPLTIQLLHTLKASEIPLYCSIEPKGTGYVLGGRTSYELIFSQSDRENQVVPEDGSAGSSGQQSDHHYIWTQTSEDVTVCFKLPLPTSKNEILCSIQKEALSLKVLSSSTPSYENARFFDHIVPYESLWTIEDNHLLTLHLQKGNQKTRWSHVFEVDDGVAETLDPNEFAEIKERLEKYTSQEKAQYPIQQPIGNETEAIDYEGLAITFSRVNLYGKISHISVAAGHEWLCSSFPFQNDANAMLPVCLRYDVDGLVYRFHAPSESGHFQIEHCASFDALGFVQASKRNKRFMYFDTDCRFAIIAESKKNVYLYRRGLEVGAKYSEQSIIDLGNHEDILGIQMSGKSGLFVLTENHLYLADLS